MEIIRYAALAPARWANGGGVTRQVAAGKAPGNEGTPEPWDWRISIAEVASAGPFSPMPGIERIITIIEGELIALTIDGVEHALEKYRPYRFSGDADTSATLPTGNLMDLNLMARRGAVKGYMAIVELSKKRPHPVFAGQHAVLLQGHAQRGRLRRRRRAGRAGPLRHGGGRPGCPGDFRPRLPGRAQRRPRGARRRLRDAQLLPFRPRLRATTHASTMLKRRRRPSPPNLGTGAVVLSAMGP